MNTSPRSIRPSLSFMDLTIVVVFAGLCLTTDLSATAQDISVFELPARMNEYQAIQQSVARLIADGDLETAIKKAESAVALMPMVPLAYYNLACAASQDGQFDLAFKSLDEAVDRGFNQFDHLRRDIDLQRLKIDPRWNKLLTRLAEPATKKFQQQVTPELIKDSVAMVLPQNTLWDPNLNMLRVFFRAPAPTGSDSTNDDREDAGDDPVNAKSVESDNASTTDRKPKEIVLALGQVGDMINRYWQAGTASGLQDVLYDNHDRNHSNIDLAKFPQLPRIEYSVAAKRLRLDHGLQHTLLFNGITIGNSSTSNVGGAFWRSQPRMAYSNPVLTIGLMRQYFANHLYVYPEHHDHDAEQDGGYGDTLPTNTPLVTISQGSSYSDRPFLNAMACTVASFRPEVRKRLVAAGMIAPTVQMIMRRNYQGIQSDAEYRSGKAHPTAFDGSKLNLKGMVEMAQGMQPDVLPPLTQLQFESEDESLVGRDYFDIGPRETLLTTPVVIARICRSVAFRRSIVVSAASSRGLTGKPLQYHWSVLRGDVQRIAIRPLTEDQSRVEISVEYHERQPISPGSSMRSNRVDIGVFTSNDQYHSAPAFVTFLWPSNESRKYADGKIQEVTYHASGKEHYVDPMLITPCDWRDAYQYDDTGTLLGWIRHRGDDQQEFSADGLLITSRDEHSRPLMAIDVRYEANLPNQNQTPILVQSNGTRHFRYQYSGTSDHKGKPVPWNTESSPSATATESSR